MIYSIGYQRLTLSRLIDLVDELDAVLVDVRSSPFRAKDGFRRPQLEQALGNGYVWRGDVLGGRTPIQQAGIEYLRQFDGKVTTNCIIMCMEHAAGECHRHHDICAPHFPQALHIVDRYLVQASELSRAIEADDDPDAFGELAV